MAEYFVKRGGEIRQRGIEDVHRRTINPNTLVFLRMYPRADHISPDVGRICTNLNGKVMFLGEAMTRLLVGCEKDCEITADVGVGYQTIGFRYNYGSGSGWQLLMHWEIAKCWK